MEHELEQLLAKHSAMMNTMTEAFSGFSKSMRDANKKNSSASYSGSGSPQNKGSNRVEDVTAFFSKSLGITQKAFSGLTGDLGALRSAAKDLASTLKFAGIGTALTLAIDGITSVGSFGMDLVHDFQKLSEVGSTFTDGLMGMAKAAAEASMSIGDYTRFMQKNSQIAAAFGGQNGLGLLIKEVRKTAAGVGNYGYTMEGLDDLTVEYLKRRQATGTMEDMNRSSLDKSIKDLARDTTVLSKAFGVSRDELTKKTTDVIQSNAFYVGTRNENVDKALTGMIAAGGGTPLATKLANIAASGKWAVNTQDYADINALGAPGQTAIAATQQMRADVENGMSVSEATLKYNNKMAEIFSNPNTVEGLKALAVFDQNAAQFLSMGQKYRHISTEDWKRMQKEVDERNKLTDALATFRQRWDAATSKVTLSFLNAFTGVWDKVSGEGGLGKFLDYLTSDDGPLVKLGTGLGKLAANVFSEANIKSAMSFFEDLFSDKNLKALSDWFSTTFSDANMKLWAENIKNWMAGAGALFDWAADWGKWLKENVSPDAALAIGGVVASLVLLGPVIGTVVTGFTALAGLFGAGGTLVKGLAGLGEAGAATAGKAAAVGAEGASVAGKGLLRGALGKSLPFLGDAILGYQSYAESGSIMRGLMAGAGSFGGRFVGGAAGTAVAPGVGTVGGEVAGAFAGAKGGEYLYDKYFGGDKKPNTGPLAVPAPANQTLTASGLSGLSPDTQNVVGPALDRLVESMTAPITKTGNETTDTLVLTLDGIKRTLVLQTEVMAGILNDVSSNLKTANLTLDAIKAHRN